MLQERNCVLLDLESHRYYWDPDGERTPMRVSVTGVTNWDKDPNRFKGYESAAHRGTHVHRCMEALAKGEELPDPISPEGIDCSDWFHQLQHEINKGLTMTDFWKEAEVLATEFTMVSRKRSLGGQLDLLVRFREAPGWWTLRASQPATATPMQKPALVTPPGRWIPLAPGFRRWRQRTTTALRREMSNPDRHAQPRGLAHRHGPHGLRHAVGRELGRLFGFCLGLLLIRDRPAQRTHRPKPVQRHDNDTRIDWTTQHRMARNLLGT